MKLSNLFAKLTSGNTKALTILGGLAIAGAALTTAAPAAQAQQFGFGVQFAGPRYVEPVPQPVYGTYGSGDYAPGYYAPSYGYAAAPGYWDHHRAEEWREHQEHEEHEQWDRHHEFYGRPEYRGRAY